MPQEKSGQKQRPTTTTTTTTTTVSMAVGRDGRILMGADPDEVRSLTVADSSQDGAETMQAASKESRGGVDDELSTGSL